MRLLKQVVHAVVIAMTLVVGAAAAAIIVSQTSWFKNWLRGYIVREAHQYLNGDLTIQRLGGNLFFGLEMEDIDVSLKGEPIVSIKDVGLDYNVFELVSHGMSVNEIRLNQPVVHVRREGDSWTISRLIKRQEQEADRTGPAYPIVIDTIGIHDASIVMDDSVSTSSVNVPERFDRIDAKLSFEYAPVRYSMDVSQLSFRGSNPSIGLNQFSGGFSIRDDTFFIDQVALRTEETSLSVKGAVQDYLTKPILNLQASSDKVSLSELAKIFPALDGITIQPTFDVKVAGPMDQLALEMNVQSPAGDASGKVVADFMMPGQSVAGDISVRHLDLAPLVKNPQSRTDLTADTHVDLRAESFSNLKSLKGNVSIYSPRIVAAGYIVDRLAAKARVDGRRVTVNGRASAYGMQTTTAGLVVIPERGELISYDLRGRVRQLNLQRLPSTSNVPRAETIVNADYHIRGAEPVGGWTNPARYSRTLDADLRFDDSSAAGASIASGSTASVSLGDADPSYRADLNVSHLDLQRFGHEFNVPALDVERYKSDLNGQLRAEGRGTALQDVNVTADGELADSSILGGTIPQVTFNVAIAQGNADVGLSGSFKGFDPAVLSGKPEMKGDVSGTAHVDLAIMDVADGLGIDNVNAGGQITLDQSTVGELVIERGTIDADYRDRQGDIRQLDIVGRDLNIKASGTLALNDTGQSKLTVHADTPSLQGVGKLFDVPVSGIAAVDSEITGNRTEFVAKGKAGASDIHYQENGALTVSSSFTARVPDLTLERAAIDADTRATFVTLAGQEITELTAKTQYENKQVTFDSTASQPARSLDVSGKLTVHPDHQEVHLNSLALNTRGMQWRLAPQSSAAVQYGHDAIAVEGLKLVSGDEQISADGSFGRTGDVLKVALANVDLANVDALLLRAPQLSGRVNASAEITGSKETPTVKADFDVSKGGFRQFKYDGLSGTANYSGKGITLDARLQESPTQWLTAKGYVPKTLFSAPPSLAAGAPHTDTPVAPEDRVDVTIDSSPIDLGIVQGLTTDLTNVSGTLEAHLRVVGSSDDPHPTGAVTIQNGAVNVVPLGLRYTGIDGRIDLQPDRVHVDHIKIVDNHKSEMTVSGDLAIHEREIGTVEVQVAADDFKVIDNNFGNIRIQSELRVTGELRSPKVEGTLNVTTGQVNLDEIVALTGPSPYATTPIQFETGNVKTAAQAPAPSLFDRLRMDVTVAVPNDFVVKASSLQTPDSPIGLGALTATLGGDVRATKDPGGRVQLVGVVNTVRGTYNFQGRRFDILRDGTIRFVGTDELDPILDLRTRRVIQGVEARVNITGTLKQPEIVLSSTPPLEESDILSLIVFNQPINQLAESQQISLAARAQSLAAGAVVGQIAQSIGGALNLEMFEINLAPETGKGAQVTVGQQVGQNLYVKVEQAIGDESSTNLVLEYELLNWLRLRTNMMQRASTQQSLFGRSETSGVDLLFFFSY